MKILEVKKIWDRAPHNAFTDLIHFDGQWYCAFREGQSHHSNYASIRVIRSREGEDWTSIALLEWEDGDLRDPKFAISTEDQLMINGMVRLPKDENKRKSITWLSSDGENWDGPHECPTGIDTWRWSTTWYDGYGYSFGYTGKDSGGHLYRTRNGKEWVSVADDLFHVAEDGCGTETSLVFAPDKTAYCLLRREPIPLDSGRAGNIPGAFAMLGTAQSPYTKWSWKNLGTRMSGPKMIQLSDGRFLAAVRLYDELRRTSLCWIDPQKPGFIEALKLPSGGDTSYAGLVLKDDVLWLSYYSSHEDKAAIYLAKVKIDD